MNTDIYKNFQICISVPLKNTIKNIHIPLLNNLFISFLSLSVSSTELKNIH